MAEKVNPIMLAQLYRKYSIEVFHHALRLTECQHEANDITQDIFLRCFTKQVDFSRIKDIPAYLFVMTRNLFLDTRTRQQKELIGKAEYEQYYRNLWPPADNPVQEKEDCSLMQIAIRRLPMRQRQVFLMKREHLMKNQAIAYCLGISECTVKIHLARAMRSMKQFAGDQIR